jgi:hypothetical protein
MACGFDANPGLTGFHLTSTTRRFDYRGHPDADERLVQFSGLLLLTEAVILHQLQGALERR